MDRTRTLKFIGGALRKRFSGVVARPLNWSIIDALVSLEEAEEKRAGHNELAGSSDAPTSGKSRPAIVRDDTQ